ncbi:MULTISPECIES: hypothetical protein [unclassified Shewanella]|uniref:DUF6985 domain-containing protein n=1 Tax=unclassified Shewanella TaxID=196818 RepID=UPI001BC823EA|nr:MULTISPECIES: hypothetical protein [unclassified Shewanella]GIU05198.1 hypothetical protein TUM4444_01160 [Shewanella sp. MBTL60-112-B1]GIU24285.1 hypothetical protein TUM4445_01210 [Shewanella sp. MBTL60-112-B2]
MKAINITWKAGEEFHEGTAGLNAWHEFKAYGSVEFLTQEDLAIADNMQQWFIENEKRIYALVCDYVNDNYQELLEDSEFLDVFDEDSESYETCVGEVSEADMQAGDIFKLMQLSAFVLHHPDKNAVGMIFECAWDEEHGFGIVIQGDEIISQDGAQVAYRKV